MRPLLRGISALLAVHALAFAPSVGAQEARVVAGLVVDAESGAPVTDALVTIPGTGLSAVTDSVGRFEISGVPVGNLQLVLRHVAYGEHAQPLLVGPAGTLDLVIRASSRAIELAPVGVEVASPEAQARRASGTATHVIDRATIEAFGPSGRGLLPILESRIPSLRVHANCVEYRQLRQVVVQDPVNPEIAYMTACRGITVYLDGVPNSDGPFLLQQLPPEAVERIQVIPPADASLRYADGGRGVILVETRRGVAGESPYRVHVNGFGWNEPESYPWLRVLGVSALGSAAMAGLTATTVLDCDGSEGLTTPPRCNAAAGVGAAFLTGALGRVITRWAGRTPYSEGRGIPALMVGAATASIGYLLYVHGENQDSDASRQAGQIVAVVGIPLTLTLSDRVFRMLR